MLLRLSRSLHYPITITELLKRPDESISREEPLFAYFYKTKVTEGNKYGEQTTVERSFPTEYHSPLDGIVKEWKIKKGAVIESPNVPIAEIEEPCTHAVQFGGLCTMCGKDMTEITYNTEQIDADRATINMIHDNNALRVSKDEASRVEEEVKRRLLKSKKLSLVVDLDQTIIHATVDPTVADWKADTDNPNHAAVKDVRQFQLVDEGTSSRVSCWYYIKLRPGLLVFLENISKLYELHVYTMGTRAYAMNIAEIVDPQRKIFGDRILSRDESGSLTAKNLQRIFPVDTKMVAIIDDRADVWSWSDNLVKVTPYDFFVGIGDINSSFLPKKPELNTKSKLHITADKAEPVSAEATEDEKSDPSKDSADTNGTSSQTEASKTEISPLEQMVNMSGGDNPVVLETQASKQDEEIAAQLEERPLLKKQKELDAEDEAAAAAAGTTSENDPDKAGTESDESSADHAKSRHNLLVDNDTELMYLEKGLTDVHRAFFEEYERRLASISGGRVAVLRGEKKAKKVPIKEGADLDIVPDIKIIMPEMKMKVLENVRIVFTGIVPIGYDVQTSDIALHAKSFGAEVSEAITRRTTHCIAGRPRTNKVRQAAKNHAIHIVSVAWLTDSISRWQRQDEAPYQLPIHPEDRLPDSQASPWHYGPGQEGLSDSSDMDDEYKDDLNGTENGDKDNLALGIDTDSEYDPDLIPPDLGDISPIQNFEGFNWGDVNEEMAEFLGSDADDSTSDGSEDESSSDLQPENASDSESQTDENGTKKSKKRKRSSAASSIASGDSPSKQSDDGNTTEDASTPGPTSVNGDRHYPGSRLSKRKQVASGRATKLSKVERASSDPGGDGNKQQEGASQPDEEDSEDAELERMLELEMMGS